ncbi:MAG: ATP--guanido phosphotransferase [Tissierellia bacterium]|nr:ATP--guanido phosphotransferase [Tissierellia bacterium]
MEKETILLTSRVRLARNIAGYPFPRKISQAQAQDLTQEVMGVLDAWEEDWLFYRLGDMSPAQGAYYLEANQISSQLLENKEMASFLRQEEIETSLMILEEDHLRIQSSREGLHLEEEYQAVARVCRDLEEKIPLAFDQRWGYLTACPTNVGTGLRASSMVHIPGLDQGGLEEVKKAISRKGFVLRGVQGEGSRSLGHIYQVSNEKTLGLGEEDFIQEAQAITQEIIQMERAQRQALYRDHFLDLEDQVKRAYGLLSQARLISYEEALAHLSQIQLGIDLGLLEAKAPFSLYDCLVDLGQGHLQLDLKKELDPKEIRQVRADKIRKQMKEVF